MADLDFDDRDDVSFEAGPRNIRLLWPEIKLKSTQTKVYYCSFISEIHDIWIQATVSSLCTFLPPLISGLCLTYDALPLFLPPP